MSKVQDLVIINLNKTRWENSSCSCKSWQKYLKCSHIISLSVRLKLCTFSTVAYSLPLCHKRKRGKPKKTANALQYQPNELQKEPVVQLCEEDEPEEQLEPVVVPKKRPGRPRKNV